MATCPYCGNEVDYIKKVDVVKVASTLRVRDGSLEIKCYYTGDYDKKYPIYIFPCCYSIAPFASDEGVRRFLCGEITFAMKGDIKRKGNYAIFRDKVYRVVDVIDAYVPDRWDYDKKYEGLIVLERVKDDVIASILSV